MGARDPVFVPHGSATQWRMIVYAAIDYEVDACYVGALVGGEAQRSVRNVLRLTEPAEERPVAHLAAKLLVFQLPSSRVGLDEAWRDRVDADPVLASLQGELARHPDDRCLVRRVGQRREELEAEASVQ
jgi:hypothetical protein